jgi:hypothetical protein
MKKICLFAALLCLTSNINAGLKKGQSESKEEQPKEKLSLDQVKQCSAADGTVIIENVLRLEAGNIASFLLPNGKNVVGKVTKHNVVEDKQVQIVGLFLNEPESGFGFVFDTTRGVVGGTLVFKKTKEVYRLRFNEMKAKFYLFKDIYKEETDGI